MERAERFIVLAFGLLFFEILIPVLWVMLGLSLVTAVQRFVKVWRQATSDRPVSTGGRSERRQLRTKRREQRIERQRHAARTRSPRH